MSDEASSPASTPRAVDTPRYLIILSTVLAVALIIAVITAAKITVDRKVYAPMAMGPVDAPEASSQVCADFVDRLPGDLGRFRAVELREPAPSGAAGYRDSSGAELSVRCGVNVPDQYTVLSPVFSAGEVRWTAVSDATPGSDLRTWYAVGGSPAVAVTTSADVGGALGAVGSALSSIYDANSPAKPAPYPLSDAPVAGGSEGSGGSGGSGRAGRAGTSDGSGRAGTSGGSGRAGTSDGSGGSEGSGGSGTSGGETDSPACRKFLDSLPSALGSWRLVHTSTGSGKSSDQAKFGSLPKDVSRSALDKAPSGSATYLADDREPVVIRCGLAMPKSYAPGAQLTQVDDVPWFSDPSLSRGSTMGHWYALGHEQIVGLAMPQSAGDEVIASVTSAISSSLKKTEKQPAPAQQ
ncbi:hypothetical protein HMPREF2678_07120 [Corynebacterium sp. HMSC058E07]|uniref:DUF3515 domain-containing protein n=1 Tax=Corynebacterium sp. HMSC058E07 TaxID=1715157 RepID=UPI0008A3396F|nr:DUF3515 domain-containing protein [Corynebacterium sp. HMSC058E07]OFM59784.1 hypothetical protein HMPREF2678_07120 [Corynebacterium sp. HMSC058E07]